MAKVLHIPLHHECTNGIGQFSGCQGRSSYSLWHLQSLPWSMSLQVRTRAHVSSGAKIQEWLVLTLAFPCDCWIPKWISFSRIFQGPPIFSWTSHIFLGGEVIIYSLVQETPCTLHQHSMAYNLPTGVFVDTAIEKNQTDKDLPGIIFTFEVWSLRSLVEVCKKLSTRAFMNDLLRGGWLMISQPFILSCWKWKFSRAQNIWCSYWNFHRAIELPYHQNFVPFCHFTPGFHMEYFPDSQMY